MTEIEKLVEALELEIETAMAIGGGDVEAASAALTDAFDAQAERIAELEAEVAQWIAHHNCQRDMKRSVSSMLSEAHRRIAELEAALSHLEWCRIGWNICPMCGLPEMLGHDDDCELDALLHTEAPDEHSS